MNDLCYFMDEETDAEINELFTLIQLSRSSGRVFSLEVPRQFSVVL